MMNMPGVLQTRADFERMHSAALNGLVSRVQMVSQWQGLLSSSMGWVLDLDADAEAVSDNPSFRVFAPSEEGGEPEVYRQQRIYGRMDALGYSPSDIETAIAALEDSNG